MARILDRCDAPGCNGVRWPAPSGWTIALRLYGLNAPEKRTAAGHAAASAVERWMEGGETLEGTQTVTRLLVATVKDNDYLIETGHAAPWDGKGTKPTP